jgi:hypothetical protein
MRMVGADWIKSDKRQDDLASRPGGIVRVCCTYLTKIIDYLLQTTIYIERERESES